MRAKRAALDAAAQQAMRDLGAPFEKELRASGLAMVTRQAGGGVQPDILPVIDGEPVPFERLEALESQGKIELGEVERIRERIADFAVRFEEINHRIAELRLDHRQRLRALLESETRRFLGYHIEAIESEFDLPAVARLPRRRRGRPGAAPRRARPDQVRDAPVPGQPAARARAGQSAVRS